MKKSVNYLIILGFAVLFFVTAFATAFLGFIHPVGWVAFPIAAALLGAFSYYCVASRWQRFGAGTLIGLLFGLFLLATGESNLQTLLIAIGIGLLSDVIRLLAGNTASKSTRLAYPMLSLCVIGWTLALWTNTQWYYDNAVEEMGIDYAEGLMPWSKWWVLVLLIAATAIFAYIGIRLACKWMKQSTQRFEK